MLKTYWHMALGRADHTSSQLPPAGVAIRPLRLPQDLQPVATLYGLAFAEDPWPLSWHDFPGFDAAGVFLAWKGEELVGFVVSYVPLDHPERGYISVVATAPSHRRLGVASALMTTALDRFWTTGFDQAAVDVAEDNPAAIAAYQKLGFRKAGEFIADEHCRVPPEA